jgi:hypothetical protein
MNHFDNRSEYYASEHMAAHIDLERIEREEAMRKLRPAPRTLAEAFPDSPQAHFATYEAEISDFAWTVLGYVLAFFTGFFAAVLMM